MRSRVAAALVLALLVAGCGQATLVVAPGSDPPRPNLTEQGAEDVARTHVENDAVVVSADFGPRGTLSIPSGPMSEPTESPAELVWLVTYEHDFAICNPLGTCLSPRPGYSFVVIDDATGEWVTTYGYSAP